MTMSPKALVTTAFVGAIAFGVARAAVKPGENLLLNGTMEADQVDWPSGWLRNRVEGL